MLEQLKALVQTFARTADPFDPEQFEDDIASRTAWTPAVSGGTNIHTHDLRQVSPQQAVFSATWKAWAFTSIFLFLGAVVGIGGTIAYQAGQFDASAMVGLALFSGIFMLAGALTQYWMCAPRTFDRRLGIFWKGRRVPPHIGRPREGDQHVTLDMIYALQILREYCSSDGGGFYSYELNLVLQDGERVNVVDHGKVEIIRRDAKQLAEFLGGIPVWDASP